MATSEQQTVTREPAFSRRLQVGRWQPSWKRPGLTKATTLVGTLPQDTVDHDSESELSGAQQRILQLEKNMLFMREQHRDTLEQLHKEIERLKSENRELAFKLVMCRCDGGYTSESKGSQGLEERDRLEDEIQALRASLAQERARSRQLKTVIEQKVLEHQQSMDQSDNDSAVGIPHRLLGGRAMRPPTLAECEGLIKHLQTTNSQQSHELQQIKADLRDVLFSHKWTPDAFLLARAYVTGDKDKHVPRTLPKIVGDNAIFDTAYRRVREEVTLPALKPHVSSSFPQRQKRTLALNRSKLGRSLP